MKRSLAVISLVVASTLNLFAQSSIQGLLEHIEKKSDLSEKTKLENSGFSTIYTRHDLDMMQVHSLRDILKYSFDGYKESRYGLPDPLNFGYLPFSSSLIRVFIDDHEITTSMYGSGLVVLGDLDLGFADHIEVYHFSTSFDFSAEPTLSLIRIFSKKSGRDTGGSLKGELTQRKGSTQTVQYIGHDEAKNYLVRVSASNDKRETYETRGEDLSRDAKRYTVLTTLHDETQSFLLNASKNERDGWLGTSLDTTLDTSKISFKDAHIGYMKQWDAVYFSVAYDALKDYVRYEDTVAVGINHLESKSESSVISSELKYSEQLGAHHLIAGLKHRYKMFEFDMLQMNHTDMPLYGHTRQSVSSVFLEESYALSSNVVTTLGIQGSHVSNNAGVKDDFVKMARAGVTYTNDTWTSKTFAFHNESYVDPYLINSFYVANAYPKNQVMDTIAQELKYKNEASLCEAFLSYSFIENAPFSNAYGLLETATNRSPFITGMVRYTYHYGTVDSLSLAYMYKNMNHKGEHQTYENHRVTLRHLHRFQKFDFFEELFYDHDALYDSNGYDVTLGVQYHVSDDLTIRFKVQNLLDKAQKQYFPVVDSSTGVMLFGAPTYDRQFVLGFEWLF